MKNKILFLILLFLSNVLFVTAQKKQTAKTSGTGPKIDITASQVLMGKWEGEMSGKKLLIVIEKINGKDVTGYNILGTNKRPLKGSFKNGEWDQPCSKAFDVTLIEPGDDKWDGVFTVKFVGYEDEGEGENGPVCKGNLKGVEANGKWRSNNGKSAKDFTLAKQK